MRHLTVTILSTYFKCPRLAYFQYRTHHPFSFLARHRAFGDIVHAARSTYQLNGRFLEDAHRLIDQKAHALAQRCRPLPEKYVAEAKAILDWVHTEGLGGEGEPIPITAPLQTPVGGNRLIGLPDMVQEDDGDLVLTEYKTGKEVNLEPILAQLKILSYLIYRTFGRTPARWVIELLGKREVLEDITPERNPLELELFVRELANAVAWGRSDPTPFHESFCGKCPARYHCGAFCHRVGRTARPLNQDEPLYRQRTLFPLIAEAKL